MKLNGCLNTAFNSAISLDEIKTENYDFNSETDGVLNEFNELLAGIKFLRSHSEEPFQTNMVIEAKMKFLEIIKPKYRP